MDLGVVLTGKLFDRESSVYRKVVLTVFFVDWRVVLTGGSCGLEGCVDWRVVWTRGLCEL